VGFNICRPPLTTDYLIADVFWIGTKPLRPNGKIDFLCGTQRCSAQVGKISEIIYPANLKVVGTNANQITDSQVGNPEIKPDSPICVDPFD